MNETQEAQINQTLEKALKSHQDGDLQEAKQGYLSVMSQIPHEPVGVMHLLGLVHHQLGEFLSAAPLFEKIVQKHPENATYHLNLGLLKIDLNKPVEAEASLRQATTLNPENIEAQEALATVYKDTQNPEKAIAVYQKLATQQPQELKWRRALVELYEAKNRMDLALPHLEAICALDTQLVGDEKEALQFKIAKHYYDQNLLEKAADGFKQILSANKQHNQSILYYAQTLSVLGRAKEARTYFQALYVKSLMPGFRYRRLCSLPIVYQNQEEMVDWASKIDQDIEDLKSHPHRIQNPVSEIGTTPFYFAYNGMQEKDRLSQIGDLITQSLPQIKRTLKKGIQTTQPRVAIVSRHLHSAHTIQRVFGNLLRDIDRDQFEVIECPILSFGETLPPKALNQRNQVVSLPISDYWGSAEKLLRLNADMIVYTDLALEQMSTYLAMHRLAPVQCVLWGHPVTSGLPEVDYYISHGSMESDLGTAQTQYREKLVLTQNIMMGFEQATAFRKDSSKSAFGFNESDHLYICPQTLYKLAPAFDTVIEQILTQDTQGHLILFNGKYPTWTDQLKQRLEIHFANQPGILERIHFLAEMPRYQFLELLSISDVMLDTPIFGGGCTSLDALSVGLPVITQEGTALKQKMTAGIYRQLGKTDLITNTPEAFVQKALDVASSSEVQQTHRAEIMALQSNLFGEDACKKARLEFESILSHLAQTHQA
jgi:protein O-GlcNAc transferase